MKKGFFVVIEGGDGCGKTTLIESLREAFPKAVFVREPGGTYFGEQIRNIIMENDNITKTTEMLLFAASRCELVDKVIRPTLEKGKLIVCDRFVYSSYVYQGMTTSIGLQAVEDVNSYAVNGLEPDLVIYLKVSKSLRNTIENRMDIQTKEESDNIYNSYDSLSKRNDNFYTLVVDNKTPAEVKDEAVKVIMEKVCDER